MARGYSRVSEADEGEWKPVTEDGRVSGRRRKGGNGDNAPPLRRLFLLNC
jgi:hypothetical protein